jgi:hypothetical protein
MVFLLLVALATIVYAGAWMIAAPAKTLHRLKLVSTGINRFESSNMFPTVDQIRESPVVLTAFRVAGFTLIVLSVIRLTELP